MGDFLEHVTILTMKEPVRLNADKLEELFVQLGDAGAEDVVCRAMEEIALKLAQSDRLRSAGRMDELRKTVRSLGAIADQIGMAVLAKVAHDVVRCVDSGDMIALAAVHQRLIRAGENSLTEIWQLQDLSI